MTARTDDGRSNLAILFTRAPAPGVWRPTPPAVLPMAVPWLGAVRPLMLSSGAQFGEPGPPPALTSARYTRDFAESKAYGSATSKARTGEQTATALFFSGNAYVQYMRALLDQVQQRRPISSTPRACSPGSTWHAPTRSSRSGTPSTFTASGGRSPPSGTPDTDGNPATTADPDWTPLVATPPYPEYVSGYAGVTGAFTTALSDVLGVRDLRLTLTSTAAPGVRLYRSGRDLRSDVVDARVWLGFHFRTSDGRGGRDGRQSRAGRSPVTCDPSTTDPRTHLLALPVIKESSGIMLDSLIPLDSLITGSQRARRGLTTSARRSATAGACLVRRRPRP